MAKAITIGLYGHEILSLIYRYGALTKVHMESLTGLHPSAVNRQLKHLIDGGYILQSRDVAGWVSQSNGRPPTAYYLSLPLGAKTAAFTLGIENDVLSLKHYRRVRLPGTTSHRLLGNEYLISIAGAEEIYSESCTEFPLFGVGTPKTDRADTRYQFARIVPDGIFVLDNSTYLLEVETGTQARKELVKKLSDYAGRWRRLLSPNQGEKKFHNPNVRPEPVVILTPTSEHKSMRDYLRRHLPDAEDWAAGDEAIRTTTAILKDEEIQRDKKKNIISRAEAGQLIIVAGIDEVRDAPLKRVYRPLYKYPEECSGSSPDGTPGWRVSLADAAAISGRITIPAKKEVA